MATSGSFNTTGYQNRYLKFSWSVKSQSVADNSTVIEWSLKGAGDATSSYYYTQNIKVIIDGVTVYNRPMSDGQILLRNGTVVATGNFTLIHKADGTRSFEAYAEAGIYNWAVNCTGSGSFTLPQIARAAGITSAADVTLGNPCSVKWTPAAASFRYKLEFSLGGWSYTTGVIHPNRTTAYTYTGYVIPLEVANQITEDPTGVMTVTLYTYSDSGATTQVGVADSATFTVTVPDNSNTKPAVSMAVEPVSALPNTFAGLYIQGLTRVKAALSATEKYGSPIDSYQLKVDGVYYDYLDDLTSGYLAGTGSKTVYGYATDKRGHTGEATKTITVLPYSAPKLENAEAYRCDAEGNPSESGMYLKIQAKRSYSPVMVDGVQKNFCAIMYRNVTVEPYSDWMTLLEGSNLATDEVITDALLGTLDTTVSYKVQIRAIDDIGRFADSYITVSTDKVYMHRDGARNALGLGKYNERDNAVDSDWDFYMNGHKVTGLPAPVNNSDAVPKSYVDAADVKLSKDLTTMGWYKLGTVTGGMCAVVTLTIGGEYGNDDPSPAMVDIATQYNYARAFLRLPALGDSQVSKIGLIQESATVCGVYLHYNSTMVNTVKVNIHTHMGAFASAGWTAADVSDSHMIAVISLIE